jgi:hypothetical protein
MDCPFKVRNSVYKKGHGIPRYSTEFRGIEQVGIPRNYAEFRGIEITSVQYSVFRGMPKVTSVNTLIFTAVEQIFQKRPILKEYAF